jgi:hypothetical protein
MLDCCSVCSARRLFYRIFLHARLIVLISEFKSSRSLIFSPFLKIRALSRSLDVRRRLLISSCCLPEEES